MKCILLLLLTTISFSLAAQEKPRMKDHWKKMKDYRPIMTHGVGVSFQQFKNLSRRMAAYPQYDELKNHMFTLSLGTMHVKKNFVSQMTTTAGSSLTGKADKKSSTMRFLSGGWDMGYDVIPNERVMLYPFAGLGFELYHAVFYRDVNSVNFNDLVNFPPVENTVHSLKLINYWFTYRLGLGASVKSPKSSHTIGLHGGYTGSFKKKSWKTSENQMTAGTPRDGLKRFELSLVVTGDMMGMKK